MTAESTGLRAPVSYNTYGVPGLIDMPSGRSAPDGEVALTYSHFQNTTRDTLTFQMTPRLSGSFRYSLLHDIRPDGGDTLYDYVFDRSFSLKYLLVEEGTYVPAISVGVNDFLGTSFFSSEYVAATKSVGRGIQVTLGLGWGRLGTVNGFDNPLSFLGDGWDTRGARSQTATGGQIDTSNLFHGDAALFGGIEWQATERLRFVAEYSSDAYPHEDGSAFDVNAPFNIGASYAATDRLTVSANYLYGSELGFQLTYALNPDIPPMGPGLRVSPLPVRRAADFVGGRSIGAVRSNTEAAMEGQGIALHGLRMGGARARVEIENTSYPATAQAVGRAARILTRTLPENIEEFEIIVMSQGVAITSVVLSRRDLESLENDVDGAWASYARAQISGVTGMAEPLPGLYPQLHYGIAPYIAPSFFDPDQPLRADLGVDIYADYRPRPGLNISGAIRQRIVGTLDQSTRVSDSILPHVRSDSNLYDGGGGTTIPRLTAAYYFRPGQELFGRVTVGYLEPMFAGASAELLWKPNDSRFAVGAELNYAHQRDFDQLFGLQDYNIVNGHISGYWDMGRGYHGQLDVGRYLAGDWGGTLSLDREFESGWRLGAFATLTDVPFDDFGEGAFDKGIRVTVPVSWINGQPTQTSSNITLRPVWRDGGARLNVDGRLYETVRQSQEPALFDSWGRFWQ
ncbi:MAG: YjbH domain-containing protein [Rhodobacteraceae bacterium]|nr:YjbH domain-containing protein [Paracoccaceae bacterium]